ncbi:hypothetical protein M5W68_14210 [Paenibacillus larvae]|uniref:hypothetical protein n=1 Tax=Paenibacillus larvae TaxID=1464 RepID=UPI00227F13A0|nr:hypothetical protein [Paenibacillus larvae]MCY9511168.1 hypothetical protein [Paenibacillus larvae]MCY9526233.1 hypothetical protein [Paenibacillus larvae]
MFKKSLVLASLATVLSLTAILPASQAFAAKPSTPVAASTTVTNGEVKAAGKWGFLIRGALVGIKNGVKYGGEALSYVVKWLDKDTAEYLSKKSSKIVKGIDYAISKIDQLHEYNTIAIRAIVLDSLRIAGVPDKYGVAIAKAITEAVDFLLL